MHFWMIQRFVIGYFNTIILSLQWILVNIIWSVFHLNKTQKISQHQPLDGARAAVILRHVNVKAVVAQSCDSLEPMDCSPPGPFVHGDSPGKNTAVGCHVLLQGIFPTQGSNRGLQHCRRILYRLSHQDKNKQTIVRQRQPASGAPVILLLWILFCFEIVVNQTLRNSYLINSAV